MSNDIEIEYIPSAYHYCCERGHKMAHFDDGVRSYCLCEQCGLLDSQIQRLTVGESVPKAILKTGDKGE